MTMLFIKGPAKAHPIHCWSASTLRAAKAKLKSMHEAIPHMLYAIRDNKGHWVDSNAHELHTRIDQEQPLYQGHLYWHGRGDT